MRKRIQSTQIHGEFLNQSTKTSKGISHHYQPERKNEIICKGANVEPLKHIHR
uniref:Uncharacterized protein n=1 Tax=Arundo donax TaxID=35708 RepID=A0A0A9BLJ2_ARUDO